MLVAALAATGIAVANGHTASVQQRQALADDYALQSGQALGTNLERADLLALAGWQEGQTAAARGSLPSRQADPYGGSFAMPSGYVATSLAISPDGRLLAVGGQPGIHGRAHSSVWLWNLATRRKLAVFPGENSTVQLWSAATGRPVGSVGPLTSVVRYLSFSPGGRTLVTVGQDTSIQLWNVASGRPVATLSGHTQQVNAVAFTPDGRTLITASADGTARVWDLNPEDEVHRLCAVLQGPGPAAQWRALNPSPGPYPCPGG